MEINFTKVTRKWERIAESLDRYQNIWNLSILEVLSKKKKKFVNTTYVLYFPLVSTLSRKRRNFLLLFLTYALV